MVTLSTLHGTDAAPLLPELAGLRIRVFREYPYLYEGSLDYEEKYLANYFSSPSSVLVIARDTENGKIVGASTAMPLMAADGEFRSPLQAAGYDISKIHYFGESVLLPEYRGLGIGHKFFDAREAAARDAGFAITAFCAVIRPAEHPLRPENYRPHHAFWTKRGYLHHPEIRVSLDWREPGKAADSPHQLSYWIRESK